MSKKHVVYIEDGRNWREIYGMAFETGLANDEVSVETREDFKILRGEIDSGKLAEVYILDNEIAGEFDEGAYMAQKIHDRAKELGKEVLVITLLCSNPEDVRKIYGDELNTREISVQNKITQAMMTGFWVGRCLKEDRLMTFNDWALKEGVNLRLLEEGSFTKLQTVDNAFLFTAERGFMYSSPREVINANREEMTRLRQEDEIKLLDDLYCAQSPGIEAKG